jgi:hypothetical protein
VQVGGNKQTIPNERNAYAVFILNFAESFVGWFPNLGTPLPTTGEPPEVCRKEHLPGNFSPQQSGSTFQDEF